ncbi:MAG: hypothetical protein ACI9UN_005424 [Granulosicoccus sp.]|jgi:hypothetical protein
MSVGHIQNSVKDVIAYLTENPQNALSNDAPITAVMEDGLCCRATGACGKTIVTDMPKAIGDGTVTKLAVTRSPCNVRRYQNSVECSSVRRGAGHSRSHD